MIEVRAAGDDDIEAVAALIASRLDDDDAAEARMVLQDPEYDRRRWTVALVDGVVRSTMASFPSEMFIDGITIPTTALEFVATDADFERQGLVRRQFDVQHAIAVDRRELVQYIVGIPYFYTRMGYDYAIPYPGYVTVDEPPRPLGVATVRPATPGDIGAILGLQRTVARAADVAIVGVSQNWEWYLRSPAYGVHVATIDGRVVGVVRSNTYQGTTHLLDVAVADGAVLSDLLDGVPRAAQTDVLWRPGQAALLDGLGTHTTSRDAYFVRTPSPAMLLAALRPVLERRLVTFGALPGTILISRYVDTIEIDFDGASITAIRSGPGEQAPVSKGGSGVPPESFLPMLLGPMSVDELDQRHPAFKPGTRRELLSALFPPLTHDVHAWVPV